jgi:ankyrin repeat protein
MNNSLLLMLPLIGTMFFFMCNPALGAFESIHANKYFSDDGQADLAAAAAAGQTGKMQKLIAKGADVNARGAGGMTVLCWAFLRGSKPGFLFLLEHGANPNIEGDGTNLVGTHGFSVISYAAMHEDIWWLRVVLQHGGNPNYVFLLEKDTPIFPAINAGLPVSPRIEHIRLLIKAGANLEARNRDGQTPLLYAAYRNHYQIVYELLKAGADPKGRDSAGSSLTSLIQNFPIVQTGPVYEWREKVIAQLKAAGIDLGDRSKWATP